MCRLSAFRQKWRNAAPEEVKRIRCNRNAGHEDGKSSGMGHGASMSPMPLPVTNLVMETGLTPDAFVRRLLERHHGTMRQQEIIRETGWSRSRVSRLLCLMEADGQVVRVRFRGRRPSICQVRFRERCWLSTLNW
ncbi:helix-turn-helix transcriptional regulator [Haladaptatus sp. NG-WS-4]